MATKKLRLVGDVIFWFGSLGGIGQAAGRAGCLMQRLEDSRSRNPGSSSLLFPFLVTLYGFHAPIVGGGLSIYEFPGIGGGEILATS